MKLFLKIGVIMWCIITINAFAQDATGVNFNIENQHAQVIYETLKGVKENKISNHIYKQGKSIVCWITTGIMKDSQGHALPAQDPTRYKCSMHIDSIGLALPGKRY